MRQNLDRTILNIVVVHIPDDRVYEVLSKPITRQFQPYWCHSSPVNSRIMCTKIIVEQ